MLSKNIIHFRLIHKYCQAHVIGCNVHYTIIISNSGSGIFQLNHISHTDTKFLCCYIWNDNLTKTGSLYFTEILAVLTHAYTSQTVALPQGFAVIIKASHGRCFHTSRIYFILFRYHILILADCLCLLGFNIGIKGRRHTDTKHHQPSAQEDSHQQQEICSQTLGKYSESESKIKA